MQAIKFSVLLLAIGLTGCSDLPTAIKDAPNVDVSFQEVNQAPAKFHEAPVRWGGTVIDVENQQSYSLIQVLLYPLNHFGRPMLTEQSQGRFFIKKTEFLDPAYFQKNKSVTVAGVLKEEIDRTIGQKTLTIPVVSAGTIYLWPDIPQNGYPSPYGYGYSPFFGYRSYFGYGPYYWGGYYPYNW